MLKRSTLLLAFAVLCFGQARHFDFTKPILGPDEKPLMAFDAKNPVPLTYGELFRSVLNAPTDEDKQKPVLERAAWSTKLFDLGQLVYGNKDCVLSIDDQKLIKDRVASFLGNGVSNSVLARVSKLFDPIEKSVNTKELKDE
jgi:hypothetical protein